MFLTTEDYSADATQVMPSLWGRPPMRLPLDMGEKPGEVVLVMEGQEGGFRPCDPQIPPLSVSPDGLP